MRLIPVDDGTDFDRMCDLMDEEEADKREAAIIEAVAKDVAENEVTS